MEYCGYLAGPPVTYSWMSMGGGILAKGNYNLGSNISHTETLTISSPGTVMNAGVRGTLKVNGVICSEDYSFEGETSTVVFDAAPTCIVSLPAGTHTIELNGNYQVVTTRSSSMSWVVHKE